MTLTVSQAARILGISDCHVRQLVQSGLMKCSFTPKGHRRFTVKEVRRIKALLKKYHQWNLPVPEAKQKEKHD